MISLSCLFLFFIFRKFFFTPNVVNKNGKSRAFTDSSRDYLGALHIVPLQNKPVETSDVHMKTVKG